MCITFRDGFALAVPGTWPYLVVASFTTCQRHFKRAAGRYGTAGREDTGESSLLFFLLQTWKAEHQQVEIHRDLPTECMSSSTSTIQKSAPPYLNSSNRRGKTPHHFSHLQAGNLPKKCVRLLNVRIRVGGFNLGRVYLMRSHLVRAGLQRVSERLRDAVHVSAHPSLHRVLHLASVVLHREAFTLFQVGDGVG